MKIMVNINLWFWRLSCLGMTRMIAPAQWYAASGVIELIRENRQVIYRAVYFDADGKVMHVMESRDIWSLREILSAYEPAYHRAPARAHKDC